MKRITALLLIMSFYTMNLCSQIDTKSYESAFISSGDNFPNYRGDRDSLRLLLISLHFRIPPDKFCKNYNWEADTYWKDINYYKGRNFILEKAGVFFPNIMIITDEEGRDLSVNGEPVAAQIADSLIGHLASIKNLYDRSDINQRIPFDSVRFFILSNVLLDNWQINNVENEFLKKERTLRNGKNYYWSLMQNLRPERESFGIYGNTSFNNVGTYGNNRYNFKNDQERNEAMKGITVFKMTDNSVFENLAFNFKPVLLQILNSNRSYFESMYLKSKYSDEISFEEYFIWWYHFIYTRATNILAQKSYLKIPAGGNFFYKFQ